MSDVKWIKLNVGMFDGNSFKKIKKAKIGGEKFRDKLTAVWFELLDFAGKCNAGGQLIESTEIPFSSIEDIAIMIDRDTEELQLCMQYFITNRMVTVVDDVYMLTNWEKYQNTDGLEKIKEKNRQRVAKHRAKQKELNECNAAVTLRNVTVTPDVTPCNSIEEDIEEDIEEERIRVVDVVGDGGDDDDNEKLEFFKGRVLLTESQVGHLLSLMDIEVFDEYVDRLDNFIVNKGAKVKNHHDTILKWYNEDKHSFSI